MKLKSLIYRNLLDEGINDPGIFKAVFLAGGPGAGKSFIATKIFGALSGDNIKTLTSSGLKIVSSDSELVHYMKKAGVSTDFTKLSKSEKQKYLSDDPKSLRSKAKQTTKSRQDLYIQGRLGLIIDGTGHDYNKISSQQKELAKVGYDTYMIFVNTSKFTALIRNKQRTRKVPDEVVIKYWENAQNNIGKFQSLFGSSNFVIIDNNNTRDELSNVMSKASKIINKWIKNPMKNPIAIKWMRQQKQ